MGLFYFTTFCTHDLLPLNRRFSGEPSSTSSPFSPLLQNRTSKD